MLKTLLLSTQPLSDIDKLTSYRGRYGDKMYTFVAHQLGEEYAQPTSVCSLSFARKPHGFQIPQTQTAAKRRRTGNDGAAAPRSPEEPDGETSQPEDTDMQPALPTPPSTPSLSSPHPMAAETRPSIHPPDHGEPERSNGPECTPWVQGPSPFVPTRSTREDAAALMVAPATPEIGVHRGHSLSCKYTPQTTFTPTHVTRQTRLLARAVNCWPVLLLPFPTPQRCRGTACCRLPAGPLRRRAATGCP